MMKKKNSPGKNVYVFKAQSGTKRQTLLAVTPILFQAFHIVLSRTTNHCHSLIRQTKNTVIKMHYIFYST